MQEIGRGSFGIVYLACWRGTVVAAKQIPGPSGQCGEALKEVQALRYVTLFTLPTMLYLIALTVFDFREIQCPSILSILGVDVGKVSIITNFVRGTSLHSWIIDASHPRVRMWISPL